jgi:hypothetical protein
MREKYFLMTETNRIEYKRELPQANSKVRLQNGRHWRPKQNELDRKYSFYDQNIHSILQ